MAKLTPPHPPPPPPHPPRDERLGNGGGIATSLRRPGSYWLTGSVPYLENGCENGISTGLYDLL